ncbi:MAG TPA: ankyrin repeat domain-containing protein [Acidimicrobiales bacterium]|nr:ankyrin repeat domain-containing protein [Acidimicrobiales bacterium]
MATIFESIKAGDIEAVRAAVKDDPSVAAARDDDGRSAVRAALYIHNQKLADVLLEAKPELDVFDAAAAGDVERLTELLDGDAELVGAWSEDGFNPLHLAAFFDRGKAVRLLLDRGADVGAVSQNDMKVQALHSAVAADSRDVAAALLTAGADPNARQEGGFTPLMGAEQNEKEGDMVRLLMDHGAEETASAPTE